MNETEFIWMDGKFVPWHDAKIHVLTHTLHYGMGVFEGIRFYETKDGPAIFRLQDHTERFFFGPWALSASSNFLRQWAQQPTCVIPGSRPTAV